MNTLPNLKWKRPESIEFPQVWRTFNAMDVESNKSIEYRIQDLPESRFTDGIDFMVQHFCRDEPICESLGLCFDMFESPRFATQAQLLNCIFPTGIFDDREAIETFKQFWTFIFKQKMVIACFKDGSDEIFGMNANYVKCKEESTMQNIYYQVKVLN